jgi:hypothetical protein
LNEFLLSRKYTFLSGCAMQPRELLGGDKEELYQMEN